MRSLLKPTRLFGLLIVRRTCPGKRMFIQICLQDVLILVAMPPWHPWKKNSLRTHKADNDLGSARLSPSGPRGGVARRHCGRRGSLVAAEASEAAAPAAAAAAVEAAVAAPETVDAAEEAAPRLLRACRGLSVSVYRRRTWYFRCSVRVRRRKIGVRGFKPAGTGAGPESTGAGSESIGARSESISALSDSTCAGNDSESRCGEGRRRRWPRPGPWTRSRTRRAGERLPFSRAAEPRRAWRRPPRSQPAEPPRRKIRAAGPVRVYANRVSLKELPGRQSPIFGNVGCPAPTVPDSLPAEPPRSKTRPPADPARAPQTTVTATSSGTTRRPCSFSDQCISL